ncbi:hypothetical protein V1511DRAFT_73666 [Dipodascopsis uninucleata]
MEVTGGGNSSRDNQHTSQIYQLLSESPPAQYTELVEPTRSMNNSNQSDDNALDLRVTSEGPRDLEIVDLDDTASVHDSNDDVTLEDRHRNKRQRIGSRREIPSNNIIELHDDDDTDYGSDLERIERDGGSIESSDEEHLSNSEEDAITFQQQKRIAEKKVSESSTLLSDFNCVICFDQPDILAATPCGHLYCRDCIYKAVSSTSKATATTGECSVCRRKVLYKKIVCLEMMLGRDELDALEEAEPNTGS